MSTSSAVIAMASRNTEPGDRMRYSSPTGEVAQPPTCLAQPQAPHSLMAMWSAPVPTTPVARTGGTPFQRPFRGVPNHLCCSLCTRLPEQGCGFATAPDCDRIGPAMAAFAFLKSWTG